MAIGVTTVLGPNLRVDGGTPARSFDKGTIDSLGPQAFGGLSGCDRLEGLRLVHAPVLGPPGRALKRATLNGTTCHSSPLECNMQIRQKLAHL